MAKAMTWRFVATSTTGIIAYIVTGHLELAAMIFGIDAVVKFGLYYLHERLWYKTKWGVDGDHPSPK